MVEPGYLAHLVSHACRIVDDGREEQMHRWIVYVTREHERIIPYYKLHVYHAEVLQITDVSEVFAHIGEQTKDDAVTYVIAPVLLYRNFTQRVIELFRNDYAHAYDLTATIGVDAFRDGRRSRRGIKAETPWISEWLGERWRGAGHIPRGETLTMLTTLRAEYRTVPLTAWNRTPECEQDGYP